MIIGNRVCLRAIEKHDLPTIVKWRNDPIVYESFFEYEPLSLVQQERWFESYLSRQDQKLFIIALPDGMPLGTVGLVAIDWRSRQAECGRLYIGDPTQRMKGYGSEGMFLLLQYAFDHLNLNSVYCRVFAFNSASLSLFKRLGFTEQGVLREHIYHKGRFEDVVILGLLAREFNALR